MSAAILRCPIRGVFAASRSPASSGDHGTLMVGDLSLSKQWQRKAASRFVQSKPYVTEIYSESESEFSGARVNVLCSSSCQCALLFAYEALALVATGPQSPRITRYETRTPGRIRRILSQWVRAEGRLPTSLLDCPRLKRCMRRPLAAALSRAGLHSEQLLALTLEGSGILGSEPIGDSALAKSQRAKARAARQAVRAAFRSFPKHELRCR